MYLNLNLTNLKHSKNASDEPYAKQEAHIVEPTALLISHLAIGYFARETSYTNAMQLDMDTCGEKRIDGIICSPYQTEGRASIT